MTSSNRIEPLADYAANTAKRAGKAVSTWRTASGLVAKAEAAVTAWEALTTAQEAAENLQRTVSLWQTEMTLKGARP